MTNKKSTKRALLFSLLTLVLCASMLVGSTYAWFTDTVTSTNNKIQSGTLKVDLKLHDKVNGWQSVKESHAPIFNYDNWEPGYVDVKLLMVENYGTLALKWAAKFVSEETLSPLADVIEVYVLPTTTEATYPADRNLDGYTYAGTVASFVNTIEETTNGTLMAGEKQYLAIALKMKESAGNDYQAKSLGSFDIQIVATQLEFEEDSFDKNYDADLTIPDKDGDIIIEKENVQYAYGEDGSSRLYKVTEEFTGDTVIVPDGIDTIGNYAFAYNNTVEIVVLPTSVTDLGRGFDSSTVKKVVLNEGLETISSRAFRSTSALEEVQISSTVKTIADDAFQKTSLKTITIPATVESLGIRAFGASKIETVIFEGDIIIDNNAFRGCADLRTVYLKGDVTFINTNGNAGCWFCNSESNNPGVSNITFYVSSEEVAAKVRTAMGAEANNTTIIVENN